MREWIYAAAVLILSGCGSGEDANKNSASKAVGVIDGWIMEDYPDNSIIIGSDKSDPTYGKYKDIIPKVNHEKNDAAMLAAKKCSHVVSVLFMRRESSLDNLRFMVDCESGERYEITSSDIAGGGAVRASSEKAIGKTEAIERCKALVANKYPNKNLLSFHDILDSNYYRAPNGNVRLLLGFRETSVAGLKSDRRASCIFDTDWKGEVVIKSD